MNAPIIQMNDDFYEDLDYESTGKLIDALAQNTPPAVGSMIGRQGSEAEGGTTVLDAQNPKAGKA